MAQTRQSGAFSPASAPTTAGKGNDAMNVMYIEGHLYRRCDDPWCSLPVKEFRQQKGAQFRYEEGVWWQRTDMPFYVGSPPVDLDDEIGAIKGLAIYIAPPDDFAAKVEADCDCAECCDPKQGDAGDVEASLAGSGYDSPEDLEHRAVKFDQMKPRFDLVPPGPMLEVAKLFALGTKKYADRNWEKGMPWGKVYGALLRHAHKFWLGFECDEESNLSHLAAVAWCALVLMEYGVTHPTLDDRPTYTDEQRELFLTFLEVD